MRHLPTGSLAHWTSEPFFFLITSCYWQKPSNLRVMVPTSSKGELGIPSFLYPVYWFFFSLDTRRELHQTNLLEKIYRWRHISMGHEQRRNRRISPKRKQLPPYNQIHGWNLRDRNYILEHESVQRCQIQQGFYPWRANTFQAYRELPIHEFLFVPPNRRHKRFLSKEKR